MDWLISLYTSLLVIVLWVIFYWYPRRRLWAMAAKMPGPKGYPIIGNSLLFWGSLGDTFKNMLMLNRVYGKVIRLWFGNKLTVVLLDPDDIKSVLGNTKIRSRDAHASEAMLPFFGNGLLSSQGEVWRTHRKLITPMFTSYFCFQVLGNTKIRSRDAHASEAMLPFFGNGLLSSQGEVWRTHRKLITPMFTSYFCFQVLGNTKIRSRDAHASEAMLPFFGNGLLSSQGEVWRTHRKLITPMFTSYFCFQVLGNTKIRSRDAHASEAMLPFFGNGLLSSQGEVWRTHRKLITPMFTSYFCFQVLGNTKIRSRDAHASEAMLPFFGNGLLSSQGEVWRTHRKLITPMFTSYFCFQVLGNTKIRSRDAHASEAMLPFFGNGLLSSQGEVWRTHRKLITPMFHFQILETYVEVFGQKAQVLVEKVLENPIGTSFNIYKYLTLVTLDAICETVIGFETNTQLEGYSYFAELLADTTHLVHNRVVKPWLLNEWLYPWTSDGRRAKPVIAKIQRFANDMITKKLVAYRGGERRAGVVTASGKTITSLLDMLIEASESQGQLLTPQEMQDEVMTLSAGGLETTASTMSFLLILIAIHKEVQYKIHDELDAIFSGDTRAATVADVHRMNYLDVVIKETLRLFPVIPILPREINEDVVLPSGYTLPRGCSTMTISYIVHRDERHFKEPEKFIPERWMTDTEDARHPYAYLPFSAGARNCVGQKYAWLQIKSVLSQILRRHSVNTEYTMEDLKDLEISITLYRWHYDISLQDRTPKQQAEE